jgi:hypothetical protein
MAACGCLANKEIGAADCVISAYATRSTIMNSGLFALDEVFAGHAVDSIMAKEESFRSILFDRSGLSDCMGSETGCNGNDNNSEGSSYNSKSGALPCS